MGLRTCGRDRSARAGDRDAIGSARLGGQCARVDVWRGLRVLETI